MKKVLFYLGVVLLFAACNVTEKPELQEEKANVTVCINDFELIQEPMTGGKASADEAVKKISFAIFKANGDLEYSTTQSIEDSSFGTINYPLYQGEYTLVAVGHRSSLGHAAIQSPALVTFPSNYLTDIFAKVQQLSVTSTSPKTVHMELDRAVSRFTISPLDTIPSNVYYINFEFSDGGYTLNPATLLSPSSTGYTHTITVPISARGTQTEATRFIILNAEEQTMDITVSAKDSLGVNIVSHTFEDVTMQRNLQTIARGHFYSTTGSTTFTFNNTWLENDTIYF